jgi:hypothetical protein
MIIRTDFTTEGTEGTEGRKELEMADSRFQI